MDCLCKNLQPLVVSNVLQTQRYRPDDARLFDENQKREFGAVDICIFRPEDVPIAAPNKPG